MRTKGTFRKVGLGILVLSGLVLCGNCCEDRLASAKTVTKKVSQGKIVTTNGKMKVYKKSKKVCLLKSGTYTVSGKISGYSIQVASKKIKVTIILKSATLKNTKTACIGNTKGSSRITVKSAKKTKNTIYAPSKYAVSSSKKSPSQDAAIYSEGNLTLAGSGTISVIDKSKNGEGVHAKNSLTLSHGTLKIQTKSTGFHGKNVAVKGGNLGIGASDTGIRGTDGVKVSSGSIGITSGDKGIQSKKKVSIAGGKVTIRVKKASKTKYNDFRGIVAGKKKDKVLGSISILGGFINVTSYGDCMYATANITISGGACKLISTADDGIQAKKTLTITAKAKLSIAAKGKKLKANTKKIAGTVSY